MPEKPPVIHMPLQPINGQPSGLKPVKNHLRKTLIWAVATIGTLVIGVGLAFILWYNVQLTPLTSDKQQQVIVTVETGTTPGAIGQLLKSKAAIRSRLAFEVYTRLTGTQNNLQAGTYSLSPSDSTPQIVDHLIKGDIYTKEITFYPGATLVDNTNKPESKKIDVTSVLRRAGYTDDQITAGLNATYNSPLFDGKPASTDLEGYIYGETYSFNRGVTVEEILTRTFDEFYTAITDNNLIDSFRAHGLSLSEGITLASIIQREVSSPTDQKQAAQVFYKRLDSGMQLGSDVTCEYIADKLGVDGCPTSLDNPYNTRIHTGLPPGPISSPGLSALLAVASPASGDYSYFLSGDDDVTYFSHTEQEHQTNIVNHCQIKCSL